VWWKTFLDRLVKGSTKNVLPDYQEKQKLLYKGNISHDELISYGDRYRKANRFFDALEFYQKAKHGPGLREIMAESISLGDAMLYEQAAKALGAAPSTEEWNRIGRRAFALKKYLFARYAFEKGGDGNMLDKINKIVAGGNVQKSDDHKA
jgi:hypothetical protein